MAGEAVFEPYPSKQAARSGPVVADAHPSLDHAVASGDPRIVRQVLPKFTAREIKEASAFEANLCVAWNRDLGLRRFTLHRSYILRFTVALCMAE